MNRIQEVFGKKHVFLPVIHYINDYDFWRNIDICIDAKADGVFLITQNINPSDLVELAKSVREKHSDLWIGVNFLRSNRSSLHIIEEAKVFNGFWSDDAFIMEDEIEQIKASDFWNLFRKSKWQGLYFGGTAFKYRKPVNNYSFVASQARHYMDVVTTSGDGTGRAASLEKVKEFSKAVEGYALALASGVRCGNIDSYLPYVNAYLVATGIETDFGILNAHLTKALSEKIHSF